ncbi:hypothetical protein [Enterococcus gallinarum]|uniref:hypothetical protein n=1 Tax=Enterococcus gallinarum TaxID=1353 RepID=UPI0032E3DB4B
MENPERNKGKIEFYYTNNSFCDFLKNTETYKDLYWSKEAFFCFLFSCVITYVLLSFICESPTEQTSEQLRDLLAILIGSLVGLLGFVIGGLALIVGSIGKKMIEFVSSQDQFSELLGIIFRFYYIGVVLGIATIIHLVSYIILLLPENFNFILSLVFLLLNSYAFLFSLISSIMLMGSCIKLMLLQYRFNDML